MKYKARKLRLEARQRYFDSMPKDVQESQTRPGSMNK